MVKTLYLLFREARPRQWVKNLTVYTSIFVGGKIFDSSLFSLATLAFLAFCAASSAIYIVNDLVDIEKDRLHPFKRNRPLASGRVSRQLAYLAIATLTALAIIISSYVSTPFLVVIMIFFILHLAYSFLLKNIILIDIMTIAFGFILRVFGGEVATGYHIDVWLLLSVISVALFLAIGKRRSELTLLSGWSGALPAKTRATLSHYSEKMMDVYISMFANSAWITYAFYTFLRPPPNFRQTFALIIESNALNFLLDRKFMMLTIPLVIYGIMRYLQLIYEKNEGESPEKVLLSDKPLILTAGLFGLMLFFIIYILGK